MGAEKCKPSIAEMVPVTWLAHANADRPLLPVTAGLLAKHTGG